MTLNINPTVNNGCLTSTVCCFYVDCIGVSCYICLPLCYSLFITFLSYEEANL